MIIVKIEAQLVERDQSLERVWGILLVILATACWSTGGVFITWIVRGSAISAVGLAFWRDLTTFSVLFLAIFVTRRDLLRVKRRDLPWLIGMGIISIGIFHALWVTTVLMNGLAIATVIQCNAPIFVTIVARLIWGESLSAAKIGAILLAVVGTILIAGINLFGGMQLTLTGLLVGLASAIAYGSVSLFGKKLTGDYSLWTILTYAFGFGALTLLPFQFGRPQVDLIPVFGSLTGLVLLSTIGGYAFYTIGLKHLPASVASISSTTEVPFAAVVSYIALGERLDGWQILGAVCVVSGVVLVSRKKKKPVVSKI